MLFNYVQESLSQFPFEVSKKGFKYLGIFLTPNLNNLFETNFTSLT